MRRLPKGANAPLAGAAAIQLEVHWDPGRGATDILCLAVDANGRVPSDDWFVFYNQPQSPGGLIQLTSADPGHAVFRLRLEALPPGIQRCICAAVLERGRFRDLLGLRLIATPSSGESLVFELTEAEDEQALILAEFYRHGAGWKLRAVGQGYRGGLKALAEHFGVTVADDPAAAPPPSPRPPSEAPSPYPADTPPPVPDQQPRGRRWPWLIGALVLMVLIGGALGALGLIAPHWLKELDRLGNGLRAGLHPPPPVAPTPPAPSEAASQVPTVAHTPPNLTAPGSRPSSLDSQHLNCAWSEEEVFRRYHTLGENYVRILQRVERSNRQLLKWRQELRQLGDNPCPDPFGEGNRQEIDQLEQLPIREWLDESLKLNACAGLMIKRIDQELNRESRPIISQRLVREADRARNLESDLTDIARDLAYLRNKTARLIDGLQENLDACGR